MRGKAKKELLHKAIKLNYDSEIPLVLDLSSGELRYDTRNEYYLCYKHVVELNKEIEKLKKEKRELND